MKDQKNHCCRSAAQSDMKHLASELHRHWRGFDDLVQTGAYRAPYERQKGDANWYPSYKKWLALGMPKR